MVKFSTWCGSLRIEQADAQTAATIDVRRVKTDDKGEHVQIAITVQRFHEKRTVSGYGSIDLRPEDVPLLITALTKLHPPYDPADRFQPASRIDAAERAFYGLKSEVASLKR